MSLEDRVRSSVDTALEHLRSRVEADMHTLVDQLLTAAAQERDEAIQTARRAAFDEAWQSAQRETADASARTRAVHEQALSEARAEERAQAEQRVARAVADAEGRLAQAQRQAEAQAALDLSAARADIERRLRDAERCQNRLLESVRGLDGATTLSEVLDALALAISRDVPRVAVLVARQDRLIGWRLNGFGTRDAQPKALDLSLTDGGVLAQAVSHARAVTVNPGTTATAPAFAQLPSEADGFAAPIIVGGRVVAVVYADTVTVDDGPAASSGWREIVEILSRHGARCLEALTVQKTTATAPAPKFWVPSGTAPGAAPDAPAHVTLPTASVAISETPA
jgi:hypothetical protein